MNALFCPIFALALHCAVNPDSGAVTNLMVVRDPASMNWVLTADRREFPWVGPHHGRGLGTVEIDGEAGSWRDFRFREKGTSDWIPSQFFDVK